MTKTSILYFLASLLLSSVVQFIFIKLSHKRGIFIDHHESDLPQKFHDSPTPRVGGIGIFISCCLLLFLHNTPLLLLISGLPAFLAGLFEDVYLNFSPNKRLLIMIASGILPAVLLNAVIVNFGFFTVNYPLGVFISFVATLGLINGANMIDGFNGLLAGVGLIIFGSFACMSYHFNDMVLFHINIIILASIAGFALFNYPNAKIFMGDGGAYLLGFFMAVISMLLSIRHSAISPFFILVCISYPVMEVIFSFIRKGIVEQTSPFQPDRKHLHMLINKKLVKGKNSQTIFIIAPVVLVYNIIAIYNYSNQPLLILLASSFIILYLLSYSLLSKP